MKIVLFLIITTIFFQSKANPFLTTDSVAEIKWPMLGESLLEEGSGNSVADWEDATNENVDFGKRKHLYSRGAVRTTVSVVLGGQFIAKLPQIAKNLISKIKRSKGRIKIKDVAKKVTEASRKRLNELLEKIKNLPNKGIDFLNDFAEAADETIEAFLKRPSLVDSWKVLDDAGVDKALHSDPDKLTKVNRYLDNNPTKKDGFIDDLKSISDPNKFVDRTSWKDDLTQQYGDDISQFSTQGLSRTDVPQSTVDDMLNSSSAPTDIKQGIVDDLINSGSTVPIKIDIKAGDELFKISSKSDGVSDFSPYWTTKSELDNLREAGNLEQKLGLPLGSHGVEYDVFKITAISDVSVFSSTIAPTLQNGYTTIGGANQTLVLDRTLWSTATKVETFIP